MLIATLCMALMVTICMAGQLYRIRPDKGSHKIGPTIYSPGVVYSVPWHIAIQAKKSKRFTLIDEVPKEKPKPKPGEAKCACGPLEKCDLCGGKPAYIVGAKSNENPPGCVCPGWKKGDPHRKGCKGAATKPDADNNVTVTGDEAGPKVDEMDLPKGNIAEDLKAPGEIKPEQPPADAVPIDYVNGLQEYDALLVKDTPAHLANLTVEAYVEFLSTKAEKTGSRENAAARLAELRG